jgi:dTMP kinase
VTGLYIALEGIEGAGKSTLAPLVAQGLEAAGHPAISIREPGGTAAGEAIRRILLDPGARLEAWTEALLFAAQRAQLAAEIIGPALARGASVVGDRSVYSSLAYQGAGRGLGVDVVRTVNQAGLAGVWPNVVVLLRLDVGVGLGRQEVADRIGAESDEFIRRVAEAYEKLAAAEPRRFVVVDASRPLDRLAREVVDVVLARW